MASFQGFDQWQHRQQRVRRIQRLTIIVVGLILLIGLPLSIFRYSRPLPTLTPQLLQVIAAAQPTPISWPATGQAAISWEGLDKPLTYGEQKPSPTASVAKLILALTVLNQKPLGLNQAGPTITFTDQDELNYHSYLDRDGSVVPVSAGQQMSQYEALQAIMIPSANNVADALANWAYGSQANYKVAAQQLVKQLGMTQTQIGSDASGMSPDTLSTAQDLVLLARAAVAHPVLRSIMSQKTANLTNIGTVNNYNTLLGGEIFGIKTGNTDEAGGCFVFAAEHKFADGQSRTFVGSVMALPSREEALASTPPLLNSVYQGFGYTTLAQKDQVVGEYTLPWAGKSQVLAANDLIVFGWRGSDQAANVSLPNLQTPKTAGSQVGKLAIGQQSVPLVLANKAPAPSLFWRLLR